MSFPPPPVESIDWDNVGFKVREVNGHIETHYSVKTGVWTEPEFIQDPFLKIHGLAPGLNYAFRNPSSEIHIFRPSSNASRMVHSASFISIPTVPEPHFLRCVHLAVALNAAFVPPHHTGAALYIRPLLFGSCAQLGLNPPDEYTFVVYVLPVGVYHGVHPVDALILEEFDRAAPEGTGSAKVGGNYAPVMRWSDRARDEGFGITLHLDSKTRSEVDEFSTSAFLGVRMEGEEVTLVVPDCKNAIKSVTSDSCVRLARSFGWRTELRRVPYSDLPSFTEVIAAGTAAALVPIKSITMRSKNDKFLYRDGSDEPGPAIVRLLTTLKEIQQGKIKDEFGWCEKVEEPKGWDWEKGGGAVLKKSNEMDGSRGLDGAVDGDVNKLP
ncbi:MAG: hypothetical protein M1816_001970 [Peltula sp. TS41687]|nr:MAG: hypothetical protein M1816_001970 [Peltula sp. TS41687]